MPYQPVLLGWQSKHGLNYHAMPIRLINSVDRSRLGQINIAVPRAGPIWPPLSAPLAGEPNVVVAGTVDWTGSKATGIKPT